jgi:hypothetical protein
MRNAVKLAVVANTSSGLQAPRGGGRARITEMGRADAVVLVREHVVLHEQLVR